MIIEDFDFEPAGSPPSGGSQNLVYASNNDTNDLFYYIGTNKGTEAWSLPYDRTSLISMSGFAGDTNKCKALSDRVVQYSPGALLNGQVNFSNTSDPNSSLHFTFELLGGGSFAITDVVTKGDNLNSTPPNFHFYGKNNSGDNYTFIESFTYTTSQNNIYVRKTFTGSPPAYKYYKITCLSTSKTKILSEMYLYGTYYYS